MPIFKLRQFGERKPAGVTLWDDGVTFAPKQENVMIRFGLIGAATLSPTLVCGSIESRRRAGYWRASGQAANRTASRDRQ